MAKGPTRVYIADLYEAGRFDRSRGLRLRSHDPVELGAGPIIGARKGRDEDVAISVFFEDTNEQEWFAPYLVKVIGAGADSSL